MNVLDTIEQRKPLSSVNVCTRGQRLKVRCNLADTAQLLTDTFYPGGAFGVKIAASSNEPDDAFDLVLNEISYEMREFRNFADKIKQAAKSVEIYSPVVGVQVEKISLGQAIVYFDIEDKGGLALYVRRGRRLDLITTPSPSQGRRAMRIVRAWSAGIAESCGEVCFHASAFVFNGLTYLVVGDAGAGKSTFSIAAPYFVAEASWLGNDRIHVSTAPPYLTSSCPMPLAVNKGTFAALGIEDFSRWSTREAAPGEDTDWATYDGRTKWRFSPREVETFFHVSVATEAPLGGLIFPQVRLGSGFEANSASLGDVVSVLERNCLSMRDTLYADDWLGVRRSVVAPLTRLRALIEVFQSLPVFQVITARPDDTRRAVKTVLQACSRSS